VRRSGFIDKNTIHQVLEKWRHTTNPEGNIIPPSQRVPARQCLCQIKVQRLKKKMLELLFKAIVKILGHLVPFTLRRHFTPQRLADNVRIVVASDGDGIEFWASDLPRIEAWVVITNLTPFALELDRCYGAFGFGPPICEFTNLERRCIAANGEERFMLRASMNAFQVEYVRKMKEQNGRASLDFHGQFSCNVNSFSLHRHIGTTHFRLCNFNHPLSTWLPLAKEECKTQ